MKLFSFCVGAALWAGASVSVSASTIYYVDVNGANPTPPYADLSMAAVTIQDAVNAANNGDLILVNDGWYQDGYQTTKPSPISEYSDTNRVTINKLVTVQSLNGPTAAFINGGGTCRCAFVTNGATLSGFTLIYGSAGWVTTVTELGRSLSKTNISNGGGVTGPTPVGGVLSNCVLTADTANGSGGGAYGVTLINCVLTGNQAGIAGGGAFGSALVGCTVTGNQALSPGRSALIPPGNTSPVPGAGGGIYTGSAVNCLIAENTATFGGGAWGASRLVNCTIVGNSSSSYGGAYLNFSGGAGFTDGLTNCLIYFNSADTNANFGPDADGSLLNYCCTQPLPIGGLGDITNDPALVDFYGGDYHLEADSLLINSGNNSAVTNSTDLDGNPLIVGGTVDIGCYEYQTPTSVLSYAWAQQYGLPTDGTADYIDSDGDGMNNWQEFIAGTNPTNAASVLTLYAPAANQFPKGTRVTWQSVNTRTYYLQRSTNLFDPAGFTCLQSNLTGLAGATSFTDTMATNGGAYFYRVGVQ